MTDNLAAVITGNAVDGYKLEIHDKDTFVSGCKIVTGRNVKITEMKNVRDFASKVLAIERRRRSTAVSLRVTE